MKKYLVFFVFPLFISFSNGQDTLFHDQDVSLNDSPPGISSITTFDDSLDLFFVSNFSVEGMLESTHFSRQKDSTVFEGIATRYDSLGKVQWFKSYINNKLDGELTSFWSNGQIKRLDRFKEDEFNEGTCFDSLGKEVDYYEFEIMPKFPGGDRALLQEIYGKLKYPKKARRNGIEGFVAVQFVIKRNGKMSEINIVKSPGKELSKETLRVIKHIQSFTWTPGQKNGEKVKVLYTLPIKFRLQ